MRDRLLLIAAYTTCDVGAMLVPVVCHNAEKLQWLL